MSQKDQLRYDGKVAIVTGAGGGLGRLYALAFAERGASVVVNDLGGGGGGEGGGSAMADAVVAEIRKGGGRAVANYDSVENGPAVVRSAIDNFGRVDIIINNAGILRDKSFLNMSDMDWDLIQRVHLKGSYSVTKAAWAHMRKQKYGRVIMTSSNSGVYGNFGQANYSAAKMGLIGLANTLALEGAKYGICVNALVPTAGSRLTQSVMPGDIWEALKPDYVAPLVLWLTHHSCTATGGVFEAAAGWFGQLQWYRSGGVALRRTAHEATPEDVRDNWDRIKDMTGSRNYTNQEVMAQLMSVVQSVDTQETTKAASGSKPGSKNTSPDLAKRYSFPPLDYEYTAKDAILYALGVGAEMKTDLRFLYESHEGFCVLPNFAVVPGLQATAGLSQVPGLHVDLSKLLHGEQYLEFHRPWPTDGKVRSEARILEVLDKGSGAAVLLNVETKDSAGHLLTVGQYTIFLLGEGGFGGARKSPAEKTTLPVPTRPPDAVIEQKTSAEQAALYRQGSGDANPLHIDPNFAKISGFKQPILHGLCSLGFSFRHILRHYAANDVSKVSAVKVRFAKPVLPGQTLQTQTWRQGDKVHFQTKVKETGEIALTGGYVKMTAGEGKPETTPSNKDDLNSAVVFEELKKRLKAQPGMVKKVQAIFLWIITSAGKEVARWTVDLKSGEGDIYEGEPKDGVKPGVTLTLDDDNMVGIVTGKLNPQQAFMSGKLKIKGNIMLTQKLQTLLRDQAKL